MLALNGGCIVGIVQIYMVPEGYQSGELWLYRSTHFPLVWTRDQVLLHKLLVDPSFVLHNGAWWLFASDHSRKRCRAPTALPS